MAVKLFKIFLSNLYSFSEFTEEFKKGAKGIAKNILFIFLGLYLFGVMGLMLVMITINQYSVLAMIGQTHLFPGIALFLAMLLIFNFGFISVASSYYSGNGEEQFLSLPITPKAFFGAKLGVSFVNDAIIGIVVFAIASGYYGYKEGLLKNPLFYIGTLVTAVTVSLLVIALIYLLFIVVLYFIPYFRKRTILNGIASFFVIVMALCIGFFSGFTPTIATQGGDELSSMLGGVSSTLTMISTKVPIISFFGKALEGKIVPILIMIALFCAIIFLFIPFFSKLYIKTFEGASDVKTKKLTKEKIDKVVKSETKKTSIFKAMIYRDIKGVWREPTFFANGPLFIFLFPLLMIFAFIFPIIMKDGVGAFKEFGNALNGDFHSMFTENKNVLMYYISFGATAFTLLCSSMSMVPSTSLSREGKGFYTLKALPIKSEIIIKAKLIHSYLYTVISLVITTIIMLVLLALLDLPFSGGEIFNMVITVWFVSSSISILLIIIDMLFDTAKPKLNWETPTAAMKQNLNTLFSVLVNIGAMILFVVLSVFLGTIIKPSMIYIVLIGVVFLIIALPIGSAYFKYANKKISNM